MKVRTETTSNELSTLCSDQSTKPVDREGQLKTNFDERSKYLEHAKWVKPINACHIDLPHCLIVK